MWPRMQRAGVPHPDERFWQAVSLLAALALHGALWWGVTTHWPSAPEAQPLRHEVRISLGLKTASAGSRQSQKAQREQPKRTEQVVKKTPPEPQKLAVTRPVKKQVALKKPEKKVEQPKPVKPVAQAPQPPKPARAAQKEGQSGVQGGDLSPVKAKETGQHQQSGGAKSSDLHDLAVREHLLSKKRNPRVLGRVRDGSVEVTFTIDRSGQVLRHALAKSSGVSQFDREAIKLVALAAPYPKAPADVHWQQRDYRITIRYAIR